MFVAYPLIWSILLRDRLRRLVPIPAPFWLMAVGICLLLWFEETWVIVDHRSPPLRHYVHYFGFYLGVTATILWLYTRYRYNALQTFTVGGLWGVLVEQQFAGPKMLATGAVVEALTFGLYIFPVAIALLNTVVEAYPWIALLVRVVGNRYYFHAIDESFDDNRERSWLCFSDRIARSM
jgi:hypothetical protein